MPPIGTKQLMDILQVLFTDNELAIFNEKNKEFIQEGQRWWDLCRMTLTKGGKHLVFCKEASLDGINLY